MFQFLIGTLKTVVCPLCGLSRKAQFQFLIGTLKTKVQTVKKREKGYAFQFLIGTLKTEEFLRKINEALKSFNSS